MQNIWKHYQLILDKLSKSPGTTEQGILTLSINNVNIKIKKLILTLMQLIIYEIWESRNNYKYEKMNLTQKTIIYKINSKIRIILNAHFKFTK